MLGSGVGLTEADLDVLDFVLIFLELRVGFALGVEVTEDLVVDPELEGLALLDHVEGETVEGERVLEGHIAGHFCLVHNLAVAGYLDFARHEGVVEHQHVVLVLEGDFPGEAFLAALDVLAHLLHVEPQRPDLLHLNQYISP